VTLPSLAVKATAWARAARRVAAAAALTGSRAQGRRRK
jgi:hypothetical protein